MSEHLKRAQAAMLLAVDDEVPGVLDNVALDDDAAVAALATALHESMCRVSHHDDLTRCVEWPKYPAVARYAIPRLPPGWSLRPPEDAALVGRLRDGRPLVFSTSPAPEGIDTDCTFLASGDRISVHVSREAVNAQAERWDRLASERAAGR